MPNNRLCYSGTVKKEGGTIKGGREENESVILEYRINDSPKWYWGILSPTEETELDGDGSRDESVGFSWLLGLLHLSLSCTIIWNKTIHTCMFSMSWVQSISSSQVHWSLTWFVVEENVCLYWNCKCEILTIQPVTTMFQQLLWSCQQGRTIRRRRRQKRIMFHSFVRESLFYYIPYKYQ